MPALSIATSVPVPIAIPTCACASAGASLIPSPAIATMRLSTAAASRPRLFFAGKTSASTSSMPSLLATAAAVVRLSPVSITIAMPSSLQHLDRFGGGCLDRIGNADESGGRPSIATNITVWPSLRCASARGCNPSSATPSARIMRLIAERHCAPSMRPLTPLPGQRLEILGSRERRACALPRRRQSRRPADARCRARGWRPAAKCRRR